MQVRNRGVHQKDRAFGIAPEGFRDMHGHIYMVIFARYVYVQVGRGEATN